MDRMEEAPHTAQTVKTAHSLEREHTPAILAQRQKAPSEALGLRRFRLQFRQIVEPAAMAATAAAELARVVAQGLRITIVLVAHPLRQTLRFTRTP